ncbi:MAG: FtsQ-type POTRA domain-containing protein [Anaerolineaceae bacterium]|nr:FtsQ-type POTRA domain-containing protein [Anaerolineaceae bacterium]
MQKHPLHKRSDKVRRRLKDESTTWINQASRRIIDPVSSPTSNPHKQSKSAKTVSTLHGNQTSRFFKVGWRMLSFLLAGVFSFAIITAWQSPNYKVSTVHIEGLQRLSEDDVLDILDIYGLHIFTLEPEKISQLIRQHFPELRDIQVKLSLPAQVSIQVAERQPMIAWQIKDNLLWIDSEGYLIPARGEASQILTIQADALPSYHLKRENDVSSKNIILDKPKFKENIDSWVFFSTPKQIDKNLLTAILQLNAWMPEESVLLYQEKRGLGWTDSRGWDVFIGSKLKNINDKMLMYETIVHKLKEQGVQPSIISVEFLHAPYYRLEQ